MMPDGTLCLTFLATLNWCSTLANGATDREGFAGYCDWLLPSLPELRTLVDLDAPGCLAPASPCIDPILGPTIPNFYWSSTQVSSRVALHARGVTFTRGAETWTNKANLFFARAVRTRNAAAIPCSASHRPLRLPSTR